VRTCDCGALVAANERLAALYHDLLGQESLAELLQRAADAAAELVPCSSLLIAEADTEQWVIVPLVARGAWQEETLRMRPRFGEGLIGWAVANGRPVLANEAHLDSRAGHVVGTPAGEPEAIVCFPLISGGVVIGAFSLYREGEGHAFSNDEFALAQRFADAVTLALANAKTRHQLADLARSDYLTGCLNRRGFHEQLTKLARQGEAREQSLALLLIDLDDFKGVNDQCGHSSGDLLLRHVADQLRAQMPEQASVARLGGDEFAILFVSESPTDVADVVAAVTRAMNPLSFVSASGAVSITASVGVAEVAASDDSVEERLLRLADESMYRRKHSDLPGNVRGRRTRRDDLSQSANG
jgi:diguanylate cyclase (GGDEF)-like protein